MRQALKLHPDSTCDAVTSIEVEVARPRPGQLVLHYVVSGAIGDLRLPPQGEPARSDELWQHSCFEAFVGAPPDAGYCEFNFAPSTRWAAYRFDGYRRGMRDATELKPPRIETRSADGRYELRASLDGLAELPADAPWQLGLSAVIEEANGRKSYWALAHPPGKADFHHPDSFAHQLPAA